MLSAFWQHGSPSSGYMVLVVTELRIFSCTAMGAYMTYCGERSDHTYYKNSHALAEVMYIVVSFSMSVWYLFFLAVDNMAAVLRYNTIFTSLNIARVYISSDIISPA